MIGTFCLWSSFNHVLKFEIVCEGFLNDPSLKNIFLVLPTGLTNIFLVPITFFSITGGMLCHCV